jgi:hypothetical protein
MSKLKLKPGTLVRVLVSNHSEAYNPFNQGDIGWIIKVNLSDYTVGRHPTELNSQDPRYDYYYFYEDEIEQIADIKLGKLITL